MPCSLVDEKSKSKWKGGRVEEELRSEVREEGSDHMAANQALA